MYNNFFKFKKITFISLFIITTYLNACVFAQGFDSKSIDEIDELRAELSYSYDKNSPQYQKTKQKLLKLIAKDKLSYTFNNRLDDVERLIVNRNFAAATYELQDLIENNYELSKCYELLGDISFSSKKFASKTIGYYELALREDSDNIDAQYKLARLYLDERQNLYGIEHLRNVIEKTDNKELLSRIKNLILNNITPQNRYEANNLYEALGWIYLKFNNDKDAYAAFEKAIELNPDDIYLKYYLADLYYTKNKYNEAVNIYAMIIEQQPKDSQIRLSIAKALEKKGNLDLAYRQYLAVLALDSNSLAAKSGIYRIFRNQSADKILVRIYANSKTKVIKEQDVVKLAKYLKSQGDSEGEAKLMNFLKMAAQKASSQTANAAQQAAQKATLLGTIPKTISNPNLQADSKPFANESQKPKLKPEITTSPAKTTQQTTSKANLQPKIESQNKSQYNSAQKAKLKPEIKQEQTSTPQTQQTPKTQQSNAQLQSGQNNYPKMKPKIETTPKTQSNSNPQSQFKPQVESNNQSNVNPQVQQNKVQLKGKAQPAKTNEVKKQDNIQTQTNSTVKMQPKLKPEIKQDNTQIEKPKTQANEVQYKEPEVTTIDLEEILKEAQKPLKVNKNSKKYLEFKKIVDKYNAIEPKDKFTYIAIANTYKLMGELYLAIDNYNKALKLEPTDSDIQYNLGLTYMELNKFQESKAHLEKAINLDKDNQKAATLLSFVNQKLITTIINKAYEKFENEQYVPAFQILDEGIKKYPKNAQLYYYRALVFDKMNRNAAQIIDLQKAIEYDPSYYMSYYQLGLAYEKIRDERSALVAYERFLSTEPDEKELIEEVEKKVTQLSKKYY